MSKLNRLEKEDIKKLLFSLALPAIIGQLVSLVYNLVDRMYIGHIKGIGGDALTGVGVTAPLIIIISAFAILIGMGGAPLASIKLGEKKEGDAENIMGNCFASIIILSIILMILLYIFSEKLLILFGASDKTLPYAMEYMSIYLIGTVFIQISIGMNSFITAQGFAKTSMMTVSIGAIINIVLDPIFIYVFEMNVKGAALATIISQAVSAFWVMRFLVSKNTAIRVKKKNLRIKRNIIFPVLMLGASPFIMNITEGFIIIAFNSSLQKYGGDVAVGAMTILTASMQFMFLPLAGLTQGAQPIMSYNFGAGNYDRLKETFKYLFITCTSYSILFCLFIIFFPRVFASLFTSDSSIIDTASMGLRIFMAGSFALGIQIACQQTFIALGNAKTSLFLAVLRKIILLIPLIYILPNFINDKVVAVILAEPISDIIAATTTGILFYKIFTDVLKKEKEISQ
ncbi:MAG: MATE family efflux transporter [Tissierellia bacterium]|nr:MATE family efflux transporter [Tissierellia bacterium]